MSLVEIIFASFGALLTIILTVYLPKFIDEVRQLRKEFHTLNVLYAERLTKVETLVAIMMKTGGKS
jgi:hypothetical protein